MLTGNALRWAFGWSCLVSAERERSRMFNTDNFTSTVRPSSGCEPIIHRFKPDVKCRSIHPSISPSVYPSIRPSICLSIPSIPLQPRRVDLLLRLILCFMTKHEQKELPVPASCRPRSAGSFTSCSQVSLSFSLNLKLYCLTAPQT